jgi:carbon storage regulator
MLIITRRPGERLVLGEDIRIEVMEVTGNTVRIGIDAPRELPVYREELWAAVKQENEAAAQTSAEGLREPSQTPPA